MNLLDLFIGSMFLVLIAGMIALWVRRQRAGAAISWKSILAWASWGVQFLFWEFLFVFDGDPTTVTLSEMMVGSVPLWAMLAGTWFVCGALLLHWWDLDRRLAPYVAVAAAARQLLESPARVNVTMAVDWHATNIQADDVFETRKRVLAGALAALPER